MEDRNNSMLIDLVRNNLRMNHKNNLTIGRYRVGTTSIISIGKNAKINVFQYMYNVHIVINHCNLNPLCGEVNYEHYHGFFIYVAADDPPYFKI